MANLISAEYDVVQNQTMGAGKSGTPVTIRYVSNTAMTAIIAAGAPADKSIWYQVTDTILDRIYRYANGSWRTVVMNGESYEGPVGSSAPNTGKFTQVQAGTFTDISGTPGNGTSSGLRGRAAFAAAASTVTITSTQVTAASSIFIQLEGAADATLTRVDVTPGAGTFTVTGNAAATAIKKFSFLVIN